MKSLNFIIETPKGSNAKYNYEPNLGGYELAKYLPAGFVFPYDFGFIPGTKGEDGDPLDVIVISEKGTFPGCIMKGNIIGAVKAIQREKNGERVENDRYIAIPEASVMFSEINEAQQLPKKILEELQDFFVNYNKEEGKKFLAFKIY